MFTSLYAHLAVLVLVLNLVNIWGPIRIIHQYTNEIIFVYLNICSIYNMLQHIQYACFSFVILSLSLYI